MRTQHDLAGAAEFDEQPGQHTARIEVHLARLAQGHDPLGHLFAIERLARAERSERQDALHHLGHESSRR